MSVAKFSPLLSLARHAQRRRMEMQCDPQWVLDAFAERDALTQRCKELEAENTEFRKLQTCWSEVFEQTTELERTEFERDALRAAISDPESVFVNMKRGTIAKPSMRSMIDLYGEVVNGDEAQLLEIAKLRAEVERLQRELATAHADASHYASAAEDMRKHASRYERLRRLNPQQFAELHQRNLAGERFDDMVDAL